MMDETDDSLLVAVSSENYEPESILEPMVNLVEKNVEFCSLCNKNFLNPREYKDHVIKKHASSRNGNNIKKYSCTYCNSNFQRHDHLKRHINCIHSICVTSHKCPVCIEVFTRKDILLKHVKKKHPDVKSFKCRDCDYECESLQDLVSHNSTHLFQDAHVCSFCKKPFKRRDHMLRHVKTLHLNQYTVCPICCQQYKRKDHMRRHCREKHSVGIMNGKIVKL